MVSSVNPLTQIKSDPQGSGKSAEPPSSLGNSQTFLQLLVAQLKNQNPLKPADSMQFVTQLAQFSQLEQMIAMRQDFDAIRNQILTQPQP